MSKNKLGMIARTKQRFDQYVLIRKYRMQQERDYFASEGESDPKRLEAQKERDKEFSQENRSRVHCIFSFLWHFTNNIRIVVDRGGIYEKIIKA